MKFGSLFTGIGGFDLAFQRAGMECAWMCEKDPRCHGLLGQRFPGVPLMEDVKDVQPSAVDAVDLICGGFPCQDLSVAGRRAGLAGARSGLWFEFHRILAGAHPRWCVIENVPGLLSSDRGRDFAVILRGLVELGYGVAWRVLDAQYFGLAQRRKRVFIVGSLGDGRAAQVLLEPACVSGHPASRREAWEGTAACAPATPASGRGFARAGESRGHDPLVFGWDPVNVTSKANRTRAENGLSPSLHARGMSVAGSISSKWAKGTGGPSGDEAQNLVATLCVGCREQGAGSSYDNTPCVMQTLRGNQRNNSDPALGANATIAVGVRRLTPRECERLQGFPDDWTAGQSDSTRYKQLGNAVAVPVAEWIARRIVARREQDK